jgi:phage shock protein PspC (stress-responsive transcriptional regulator)
MAGIVPIVISPAIPFDRPYGERNMSLADELQKLKSLHEQGVINDDEFTRAKQRLLDGSSDNALRAADVSPLHQLQRSPSDRWLGGVCGGFASLTQIPSWAWRIFFILTALLHGLGVVAYLLLWIFIPLKRTSTPAGNSGPASS